MKKKIRGRSIRFIMVIAYGLIAVMLMASHGNGAVKHQQWKGQDTTKWPATFGFGRTATAQEISLWDIAIRPDGKGLPSGEGDAARGKVLYALKCAACHGENGRETPGFKLPAPALVSDTLFKSKPKTIGNYWPYATTLFDYMRRTMPYNLPGSLTNNEVYSLTAFLLGSNQIIKPDFILNAQTLPRVIMPAKKLFVVDDRRGGAEVK
ncbi:cytochrome c [Mucilaginibacter frigoritolerans]|uniref:Cytochrome c n=1 Tax=Mucilaginibacter frigoritolerans TaxID=652788 RepID=A0A562TP54_9SPHI|nr:cytochrome c [Mucilaginibacter frigoritolerans]TWI95282.1 cytochrome c [Mucilaginibacter frigoritolerans]